MADPRELQTREQREVDALLAGVPREPEHLLPALQLVQARLGYVPEEAIRTIAEAFNRSRAEVYGVVTFYHDLRLAPVGDTVVQVCMAEACQAMGCRALAEHAHRHLGVALGHTTSDGRVHLEATYCLGNCALAPSIRIGDVVHGRVTSPRFDALVATARSATRERTP
ncbi:MAG: NAD(P)H-dependent oxidoreductase subunit E [Gemmatimonas sp.]|jgi:formate dehydrogenase subunit gamma|uniref:NADH-quinone oxidoreductase subunit NuoE family protein n=1 Tax=Gemmatimonas sp. TaxID=1962908 RepID=UPI00391EFCA1|nr:NAD(P)H-dependent oxidoreductase subunit E [Gemmatimonadota bacterium]